MHVSSVAGSSANSAVQLTRCCEQASSRRDEHQQGDHFARDQLGVGGHRAPVVSAEVEDDIGDVPRTSNTE